MALDMQGVRLTDDHTLESASEVMSQLQFDRRLPNGREGYMELLRSLGFRSNQDGEEHTQLVFQGQCLILGDARVGKTSLKKSLMGKPFDAQEPGTKGVANSLVDRNWKEWDVDAGLTFGSFARFGETVVCDGVVYGPDGLENRIGQGAATMPPTVSTFLVMFLPIGWVISILWLLAFDKVSSHVCLYTFSFAVFVLTISLHFLHRQKSIAFTFEVSTDTFPRFLAGMVAISPVFSGYLQGVECKNFEFSFSVYMLSGSKLILATHFFILAFLFNYLLIDAFFLIAKNFKIIAWSEGVESFAPGQARFNNSIPILPRILFFIIPVITGISFGCIAELSFGSSIKGLCHGLHLCMIYYCCSTIIAVWSWILENRQGIVARIFLLYIITETIDSLTSFSSFSVYMVIFAINVCKILVLDFEEMFSFIIGPANVRETRARFTFLVIEKVMLNFQKLKSALHSQFSSLKLKLLDFSGDKEYYAYHHIFMREEAIYIVVFNMANFVDDNFGNKAAKTQRLRFWLESICGKAAPKKKIFLVGTHRGHMGKTCMKNIDKDLQQSLLNTFSDELVMNKEDNLLYFPTENTLGHKDRGIQNLQREIMSKAEKEQPTMAREIPYSWIKIQDAIINLRQNKKATFCVTLQQFPETVDRSICCNWSRETLKYFHEKGLTIFVDQRQNLELSNWILLKPEILVDIIIQLVTPLTEEEVISQHDFRRDWKLLHDTGMLTESLLENILSTRPENGKALQSYLEEYGIICPLFYQLRNSKEEAQATHFVPSLLPMTANVNTPVWYNCPDDKKFYVFFHRFVPEALFQHLLSRAHKNSKVEFPRGQPVICKDAGRFWLRPSQPYRLLQLKNEEMIEVTFHYRGQGMKPSDVLCQVFSMVDGICKRHFPYVKFHCGPVCPSDHCPGYQGDYISHPGVQRSCSHRRHVFNVLPARQEDVHASFYCVNQNFEEYLKDWVV